MPRMQRPIPGDNEGARCDPLGIATIILVYKNASLGNKKSQAK